MEGNIHFFCNYFEKIVEEEAEKEYQSRIIKEIAQQKDAESKINQKIAWFATLDEEMQRHMLNIQNLERWVDRQKYPWPNEKLNSVQITNGFFSLSCDQKDMYGKKVPLDVETDRKRCQKKLIKKGVMDVKYLEQVQEKLMTSKKSGGMTSRGKRELHDLVRSMGHRIQHGNDTRAHEKKIYQEIKTVNETRELYSAPEPPSRYSDWTRGLKEKDVKGDIDWKLSKQHRIKICLYDIDIIKRHLKGRKSKVTRLKDNLELVRKNIASLHKKLENDTSKGHEAHKRAAKLGDQMQDIVTYQSIYAEKLARKGVEGLKRLCMHDKQVEIFVRRWCYFRGFKDDYDTNKLDIWRNWSLGLGDDYETRKLAFKRQ